MDQQLTVDSVEIVFEKESAIFHDGDHVTGLVIINNKHDIAYKCEIYFI